MEKDKLRSKRLAGTLSAAISDVIAKTLVDFDDVLINVGRVELNESLTLLTIGISVFGDVSMEHVLKELDKQKKHIRHLLAQKVQLKYIPEIRFRQDEIASKMIKFSNLDVDE